MHKPPTAVAIAPAPTPLDTDILPRASNRYRCRDCGRCFVENPTSAAYDPARKEEILRAYYERASLHGVSRIFGVSRNTVTGWLKKSI